MSPALSLLLMLQTTPLLVAPSERGVILRWAWDEGERPAGYFVERRTAGSGSWTRVTAQPLTRSRDRAAARVRLGDDFDRYAGLLFPDDPRAERGDPESYRGMLLLSADISPGVARLLGLRYDDDAVSAGVSYEYRLIALTSRGERLLATSAPVVAGGYQPGVAPDSLSVVSGPRGAALRWGTGRKYSAYQVYRGRRRDGADARLLNDGPVLVFLRASGPLEASPTFFTDSAPPPRDSAYYWVEGVDAFGRISRRSSPAANVWRPYRVIATPGAVQTNVRGDTVSVTWMASPDPTVTAYQLWRGEADTGRFVKVGTPVRAPAREQRDPGRQARRVVWYRVTALDAAGQESDPSPLALAEVLDLVPPAAPESLASTADTARLSLRWRPVAAGDVLGYRVYRAFQEQGTYGLLSRTPQRGTAFTDTVPARADHPFFYRITAVDSAFNESAPSAVLAVRPPDLTAPTAPWIESVRGVEQGLIVAWLANPEADVTVYRVRYRPVGQAAWVEAADSVPATAGRDTLRGLEGGRRYEVSVVARDDAGNRSAPARPMIAAPLPPRGAAPELRRVAFDRDSRAVVIEWHAMAAGEVLIWRREAGQGEFRPVGSVARGITRYSDRLIGAGRRYEYRISARDTRGDALESRVRQVSVP